MPIAADAFQVLRIATGSISAPARKTSTTLAIPAMNGSQSWPLVDTPK